MRQFRQHLTPLLKWPPKVRQHPHGNEVDADEGLDARDDAHPSHGAKAVIVRLYPGDPTADVEIAPPEMKCRDRAEIEGLPDRGDAFGSQALNAYVVCGLEALAGGFDAPLWPDPIDAAEVI